MHITSLMVRKNLQVTQKANFHSRSHYDDAVQGEICIRHLNSIRFSTLQSRTSHCSRSRPSSEFEYDRYCQQTKQTTIWFMPLLKCIVLHTMWFLSMRYHFVWNIHPLHERFRQCQSGNSVHARLWWFTFNFIALKTLMDWLETQVKPLATRSQTPCYNIVSWHS